MIGKLIVCGLLFSLNVAGQNVETTDTVRPQETKKTLLGQLQQIQQYLDSAAKRKVDPHYIEVPDKPWRVILRYKANTVNVDYDNSVEFPANNGYSEWNLHFEPPVATSIGFWAGYRGTGISFSKSLTKNAGRYFSISSTGAKYGFNFRLRRFNTSSATLTATDYVDGVQDGEGYKDEQELFSPVWIRSVYVNGYYVFNGRRYSQAAAYNQSVIQRRSAGSFLLGATWYQSSFDYSDLSNFVFMMIGHGLHRIKVHQANIGFGYGYNFVPFRGLVINAMAMPTVSVYNRVKVYKYDFNFDLTSPVSEEDTYGQFNKETKTWANGQTHKPFYMYNAEAGDELYVWDVDPETSYSWLRLNLDLRLGIAYNWSRYFIGLQAQYNNFSYKKDDCKIRLFDAYARLALGVRL